MEINLTNDKGRDATVTAESVSSALRVRWIDSQQRQATSRKVLKGSLERDIEALLEQFGELDQVGQALIEGDPEVDLENYGTFLEESSRIYINSKNEMVHRVIHWEIVRSPDGGVKERRPRKLAEPNVATDIPLTWTGKLLPRSQIYKRLIFSHKLQIVHHNGLTYDFLYGMASELARQDSLLLMAAGSKGTQPLVFRRGGMPYRGFLEGRVEGERYALILHLSNMELRKPGADGGSDRDAD